MKRKIHWHEDVKDNPASAAKDDVFEQVRKAIFDKKLAKVAKILTSLTDAQALELIHKENGQIIRIVIKLACIEKRLNSYEAKAEKFDNIYKIFLSLDKNYTHEMLLKASSQILEVDPYEPLPRLLEINKAIGNVQKAMSNFLTKSDHIEKPLAKSFASRVRYRATSRIVNEENKSMER